MAAKSPPVLLVEDRDSLRAVLKETLEHHDYRVVEAADGTAALKELKEGRFLAVVTDLKLPGADGHRVLAAAREADPDLPVLLMTAYGTVEDAVQAMKAGAFDFLAKPVDPDHLLLLLGRAEERRGLLKENLLLREAFAERLGFPRIIGDSRALKEASRQVEKVAPTDATVLIQGESGTGKELFARAVHHLSPRKDGPFVAINCAAIPENLLENELFGHERGAYTGADAARDGRIELADGGTLFLDEIGELGPAVQAKLLRVLQEHCFERVGGNRTIHVDIRVVAASNQDLRAAVSRKAFREDLYFRLAVVTVEVPPLRDRSSDIPALAEAFLARFRRELGRESLELGEGALEALQAYTWPGNIRELQNSIERAAILAEGNRIESAHFALPGGDGDQGDALGGLGRIMDLSGSLDEVGTRARVMVEKSLIRRSLEEEGGNKTRAAARLKVNYKRFLSRIKDLGLED
jgi:DNA-binding NtrC family response regulator